MIASVFSLSAVLALVFADPGFVAVPVERTSVNSTSAKTIVKNSKVDYVPEALRNLVYQYTATFTLGTNGQTESAAIDTGSSDLWVYSKSSGAPNGFDPSSSKFVNNGFQISYVDGSGAQGNYYYDHIKWGNTDIQFQFALSDSYSSGSTLGVFGIGQKGSEASKYGEYDNYPYALKDSGLIESVAYSLYLDDVDSTTGTLLFGAVDKARYTGELKQIDITSDSGFWVDFEVNGHKLNGVLDSGTSLTYLPDEIVSEIASSFGATYDWNAGAYRANGAIPDKGLTYSFDGLEITVPKSELWLELNGSGEGEYLTILPYSQSSGYILLGDTFLRSAYVVYDLDSHKIAVAQAKWGVTTPDYEVITSAGIPGAV